MEKKTMDTLRTMICGELDDIAKKGTLTHEQLDVLKDLLESAKNLEKIEKYQKEKEESEMYMDRGYSQRKFFIDADYNPYGMNSYARGGNSYMDGGNSYGRSRVMYDMGSNSYMDGGNSYMYYDPRYENPMYSMARGGRGYSTTGSKAEMVNELTQMMNETNDATVKNAISEAIAKVNK